MVYFVYNGYGYHVGHHFTFGWANDSGASINYDEYGWITFGSNGFGENSKVGVQLGQEYGHYFCSTSICGGFSNWISGIAIVTPKVTCIAPNIALNIPG